MIPYAYDSPPLLAVLVVGTLMNCADGVIIQVPPLLDQYLCFLQCIKDFSVKQLISEFAVE